MDIFIGFKTNIKTLILILHCRDLKLDNLLLVSNDDSSSIKVIDFGLMAQLYPGQSTFLGTELVGTEGIY